MKSSIFLAATSALLAMAGPIGKRDLEKRAMYTDWVYEVVTVTVTAGQEPSGGIFAEPPQPTSAPPPPPAAAPAPVVTTIVEAPVIPEPVAEPQPSSSPAPAPAPAPAPEPEPEPVPEPAPAPAPAPDLSDYPTAMLEHHNLHRRNHSAPDLEWDDTLAGYAENTANTCIFEHDMDQGAGGYGQNLASRGTTGDLGGAINSGIISITEQWYNGELNAWTYYGLSDPPQGADLLAWGHFTQVVWKSTTKVGCATVSCQAGSLFAFESWYTVCNYDPPGNFGGEYATNVLEPEGLDTLTI